jgi:hypothetical protein
VSPAALAAVFAGAAPAAVPPPPRPLAARLNRPAALLATPGGLPLARLGLRTEFGSRTVLAVVRRRGRWLAVRAAQAGNGRVGWIRADGATLLSEPRSLEVDLSQRRLRVRTDGRVTGVYAVAVGKPATPTPTGRFAVTDRIRMPGGSPYGCCALALTARQRDLPQGWGGGDRIAIHGTNATGSVGLAASLGCLRASRPTMEKLMRTIPLGAPVVIRR